MAYADAVLRAGGLPFVLPYTDDAWCVEAYLDRVSGLLVTGGRVRHPARGLRRDGARGHGAAEGGAHRLRAALMRAALKRNLPVLGVCGGMQLLNVVLGGTLFQDIGREVPDARDHEQKHDRTPAAAPGGREGRDAAGRGRGQGAADGELARTTRR